MAKSNYEKDILKQIEELTQKCDGLSHDMKEIKIKHKEEIKALNKKISELEEENQVLRNENDRLKKIINNDSNNSSNPPSTDIKPNKKIPNNREKSCKKLGGQKGHKGYIMAKSYVEEKINNKEFEHKVVDVGTKSTNYKSKYILDIKTTVVATEYRFYAGKDKKYNIPKEFQTDVQYGNSVKTLCTVLSAEGYVATERVRDLLENITEGKLKISTGSVVNFLKEFSQKSDGILKNIEQNILNSLLINTDATWARAENRNCFVRNYSTDTCTLLIASKGKSRKYIEEAGILNHYTGTIEHDHETVIYNYGSRHGECNVHISRYLKGCLENTKHKWAKYMRSFLCCLNNYKKDLVSNNVNYLSEEKLKKYIQRYDAILELGFKENKELKSKYYKDEEKRLLNRLKKYKNNHLLFIYDFSVPFDNNLSERDLRHVKSKIKISGCFRSLGGLQNYLDVKSIIGTCKKKCIDFYETIFNIYAKIPVNI